MNPRSLFRCSVLPMLCLFSKGLAIASIRSHIGPGFNSPPQKPKSISPQNFKVPPAESDIITAGSTLNISLDCSTSILKRFVEDLESLSQDDREVDEVEFRSFLLACSSRVRNDALQVKCAYDGAIMNKMSLPASSLHEYLWKYATLASGSEELDLMIRGIAIAKNMSIRFPSDAMEHILESIALITGPAGPVSQAVNLLRGERCSHRPADMSPHLHPSQ